MAEVPIWERDRGFPVNERGFPEESRAAYEKFQFFLSLGPSRTQAQVANHFNISKPRISQFATQFCWQDRAKAYDLATQLDSLVTPDELTQPLPQMQSAPEPEPAPEPAPEPPTPAALMALRDLEHEKLLEEYRDHTERLGRSQLQISRAMTTVAGRSVQQLLESRETLRPRELSSFIATAVHLAAAAQQNWGRAIGVDRLLMQMEGAALEFEQRLKAAQQNSGDVEVEVL